MLSSRLSSAGEKCSWERSPWTVVGRGNPAEVNTERGLDYIYKPTWPGLYWDDQVFCDPRQEVGCGAGGVHGGAGGVHGGAGACHCILRYSRYTRTQCRIQGGGGGGGRGDHTPPLVTENCVFK